MKNYYLTMLTVLLTTLAHAQTFQSSGKTVTSTKHGTQNLIVIVDVPSEIKGEEAPGFKISIQPKTTADNRYTESIDFYLSDLENKNGKVTINLFSEKGKKQFDKLNSNPGRSENDYDVVVEAFYKYEVKDWDANKGDYNVFWKKKIVKTYSNKLTYSFDKAASGVSSESGFLTMPKAIGLGNVDVYAFKDDSEIGNTSFDYEMIQAVYEQGEKDDFARYQYIISSFSTNVMTIEEAKADIIKYLTYSVNPKSSSSGGAGLGGMLNKFTKKDQSSSEKNVAKWNFINEAISDFLIPGLLKEPLDKDGNMDALSKFPGTPDWEASTLGNVTGYRLNVKGAYHDEQFTQDYNDKSKRFYVYDAQNWSNFHLFVGEHNGQILVGAFRVSLGSKKDHATAEKFISQITSSFVAK